MSRTGLKVVHIRAWKQQTQQQGPNVRTSRLIKATQIPDIKMRGGIKDPPGPPRTPKDPQELEYQPQQPLERHAPAAKAGEADGSAFTHKTQGRLRVARRDSPRTKHKSRTTSLSRRKSSILYNLKTAEESSRVAPPPQPTSPPAHHYVTLYNLRHAVINSKRRPPACMTGMWYMWLGPRRWKCQPERRDQVWCSGVGGADGDSDE